MVSEGKETSKKLSFEFFSPGSVSGILLVMSRSFRILNLLVFRLDDWYATKRVENEARSGLISSSLGSLYRNLEYVVETPHLVVQNLDLSVLI
jgi:hypothetical protein